MIRRDIVSLIKESLESDRKSAEKALDAVLNAIVEGCTLHGEVVLRGFGTFRIRKQGDRLVKSPFLNSSHNIPPRKVLKFKGSRSLIFT